MPPPGAAPIAPGMTVAYNKWTNAAAWVAANPANQQAQALCTVLQQGQPNQLCAALQTVMSYIGTPMTQHENDEVNLLVQNYGPSVRQLMGVLYNELCIQQRAVHVSYTAPAPALGGAAAVLKHVTVIPVGSAHIDLLL